jgi:hypothetical protein
MGEINGRERQNAVPWLENKATRNGCWGKDEEHIFFLLSLSIGRNFISKRFAK